MNIVVLSNHFSGFDCLRRIDTKKVPISKIVTTKPELNEKKSISGSVNFESLNIPIEYLSTYNMKNDIEYLKNEKIDILLVMGFQRLVPDEVIQSVRIKSFGYHGSSEPLPKGRGRSPINWELIGGKDRFILSMFELMPGADEGNIYAEKYFEMNQFDTVQTVYHKVSLAMREMTESIIPKLVSGLSLEFRTQEGEPSFFPKRTPEDGKIVWSQKSQSIYNFVRALARPYPGAFSMNGENRITLQRTQIFTECFSWDCVPGTVVEVFTYDSFVVKTSDGVILVTDFDGEIPRVGDVLS